MDNQGLDASVTSTHVVFKIIIFLIRKIKRKEFKMIRSINYSSPRH